MERYKDVHRMKTIQLYFENQQLIIATQWSYYCHFDVRDPPSFSMIGLLLGSSREEGLVKDLWKSGRPFSTTRSEGNIQWTQSNVEKNPGTLTWRCSFQLVKLGDIGADISERFKTVPV